MRMRCAASVCAWLKSVRSPTGFRVGLFERAWEAASARTIGVVGSRGLRPGRRWRRLRDTAWTAWCCWWRPGSRPARAQSGGCARRVSMGRGHHGAAPWPRAHPCSSRGSDTTSFLGPGRAQQATLQGSRAPCTRCTHAPHRRLAARRRDVPGQPRVGLGWVRSSRVPQRGKWAQKASRSLQPSCARHPPGGSARARSTGHVADMWLPPPLTLPHALIGCRNATRLSTPHLQVFTPRPGPACRTQMSRVGVFCTQPLTNSVTHSGAHSGAGACDAETGLCLLRLAAMAFERFRFPFRLWRFTRGDVD